MTDEASDCLAKLTEAHESVEAAARILDGAVDADSLSKVAIENEVGQISMHLQAVIQRLDDLPNVRM